MSNGDTRFRQQYSWEQMRKTIDIAKSCEDPGKPKVGAALIKNGEILEEARRNEHNRGEHAEMNLFDSIPEDIDNNIINGSILITTLEPCTERHDPGTPPCTDMILKQHYTHHLGGVVVGMLDKADEVRGKGIMRLRQNNIRVDFFPPELNQEVRDINQAYLND